MVQSVAHLNSALQSVLLAALAVGAGYVITYLRSTTIGRKLANAERALVSRLAPLVGRKTIEEAETYLLDVAGAEVARLTGLSVSEVIVIGDAILHDLWPHPAPAPTPTPEPAPAPASN